MFTDTEFDPLSVCERNIYLYARYVRIGSALGYTNTPILHLINILSRAWNKPNPRASKCALEKSSKYLYNTCVTGVLNPTVPPITTMKQPIKALIFDAEGVVIDTMHTVWIPADTEFCRRRGFDCPDDLLTRLTGTTLMEGVKIFKQYHGFKGDNELLLQERINIIDELFKKNVSFVNGFEEFFNEHQNLLSAIATSLRSENLKSVDNHLHLKKIFQNHVYNIYETGVRSKPNPDIFLYAAKQLNTEPARCLVFEDAPNGIEAARRAGMPCVALTTTFPRKHLKQADVVVDSFSEINIKTVE